MNRTNSCTEVRFLRHGLLPTILQLETISISRPAAHGIAATHGNIGLPIKVRSRAHDLSYNRISERLESAKRLHRYLNFADDGNHARLDTSIARFVGFLRLGYFTIGSNPPRVQWSGSRPSRLLRRSEAANLSFSFQSRSCLFF